MYVSKGGPTFGFCAAKATWDNHNVSIYRMLIICAETGTMWEAGGVSTQPSWFVELLAWFLPRYNDLRFYSRAKSILGEAGSTTAIKTPGR